MVARKHQKPVAARRDSNPLFTVPLTDLPYPYNLTTKGLPFAPYTCSKCGYAACTEEFDDRNRALPLLRKVLPHQPPFSVCPQDEGPDFAQLLSPTRESWRSRETYSIRGRQVTACILGGVLEQTERTRRTGTLVSGTQLRRDLYLQFYLDDKGPLEDLNLECLLEAPYLHGRVFKVGDTFLAPRKTWITSAEDDWQENAHKLSLRIQGSRPGFLSADIARAIDPRLGIKMFDENQFLAVPFNLAMPLREQWDHIRPWLDDLANYAYRFTKTKRPRLRPNLYRDIYAFLSVRVEGRKVASVAHEIFPTGNPRSRQKTVREMVRKIEAVVRKARIALPRPNEGPMPQ